MKKHFCSFLMVPVFFLSACSPQQAIQNNKTLLSKSSPRAGLISVSDSSGEQENPLVSLDPGSPAYQRVTQRVDRSLLQFNNQMVSDERKIYSKEVVGIELRINSNKAPWNTFGAGNISELTIAADRVIFETTLKVPGANVLIAADQVTFKPEAVLDITPLGFAANHPAYTEGLTLGRDGATGIAGGKIHLQAGKLIIEGTQDHARFVARGGSGENAGLGRNGTQGVSYPSLGKNPPPQFRVVGPAFQPHEFLGRERGHYKSVGYCRGDWPGGGEWKFECGRVEITLLAEGILNFPGDGEDAIAPGHPGAGGPGGFVLIQTPEPEKLSSSIIKVSAGEPGRPAPSTEGGAAGTPRRAAILRGQLNGTRDAHYLAEVRESQPGKPGLAPQQPKFVSEDGQLQVETYKGASLTKNYLENKMAWIRDLYLAGHYQQTKAELEGLVSKLDMQTLGLNELTMLNRAQKLRLQLINSQDYFGEELTKAPLYSFDIDVAKFNAEIEASLRVMHLSAILSEESHKIEERREALKQLIAKSEQELEKSFEKQSFLLIDNGQMQVKLKEIVNQELALKASLLEIEKQLEKQASLQVESEEHRRKVLQGLKTVAALSKVFPAGQPTLLVFGSALETLISVPQQGSVKAYLDYVDANRLSLSKFDEQANWDEAQQSLKDFWQNFKPDTYKGLSKEEARARLGKVYDASKPLMIEIEKSVKAFDAAAVKPQEFNEKLEQLKAVDPLFKELVLQLKKLAEQRALAHKMLNDNIAALTQLIEKIQALMVIKVKGVDALTQENQLIDGELVSIFQLLAEQAEDRLLYYYQILNRSFEYVALKPVNNRINLGLLMSQMRTVLQDQGINDRFQKIQQAYQFAVENVLNSMNAFLEKEPDKLNRIDTKVITLTEGQLQNLGRHGVVELFLSEKFYGDERKNIRIKNIEILRPEFDHSQTPWMAIELAQASGLRWVAQLEPLAIIEDQAGREHFFTYYGNDSIYRWEATTQITGTQEIHQQNVYDPQTKNILASLLRGHQSNIETSDLFATHGGKTSLRLSVIKENRNQPLRLKNFSLKVTYSYY